MIARAFAWLTTNQPLAKDYERLIETGEMPLYLSMSRILLPRLATKKEILLLTSLSVIGSCSSMCLARISSTPAPSSRRADAGGLSPSGEDQSTKKS